MECIGCRSKGALILAIRGGALAKVEGPAIQRRQVLNRDTVYASDVRQQRAGVGHPVKVFEIVSC